MKDYKQRQKNNNQYRLELIRRATKAELIVKEWLERRKIRFIFQKGFLKPFHRICDFYIPKRKIIIEIDGDYHNLAEVKNKDARKDFTWAKDRGMGIIRLNNEEVYSGKFEHILNSLI